MGEGSRLQGSGNSLRTSEVGVAQRFLAPRISWEFGGVGGRHALVFKRKALT